MHKIEDEIYEGCFLHCNMIRPVIQMRRKLMQISPRILITYRVNDDDSLIK